MKTKCLKTFLILTCLLVLCFKVSAASDNLSVEITIPSDNYEIQNISDACVYFNFYLKEGKAKTLTIEYTIDNWGSVYKEECVVNPKRNISKKVDISHLPKGVHKFMAKIVDGEEVLYEFEKDITLIEYYISQPLDYYSPVGMHAAFSGVGGLYNNYQIDLMNLTGITKVRPGWILDWNKMERTPFYYSFDYYSKILKQFNDAKISLVGMPGGLNAKHNQVPRTDEDYNYLEKFVKFYMDTVDCDVYELWNEPDLDTFFRGGDDFAIHYSTVAKKQSLIIKEKDPDAIITAASVSGGGDNYMGLIVDRDVMPYVDAYAIHPYSDNAIDKVYYNKMLSYDKAVEKSGHWLHKHITELGYPTMQAATTGRATTIEKQPDLVLKFYVLSDRFGSKLNMYYQFMDTGYDASNSEQMYGVVKYASTNERKPAFAIMPQLTKMLNSAQYVGYVHLTDTVDGHIYWYYGKPLMVAWSKDGESGYNFDEELYVEDRYGNKIETNGEVLFNTHPYYIQNLSDDWFKTAVKTELSERYEKWIEEWQDKVDVSKIAELKAEVENTQFSSGKSVIGFMDKNYEAGLEIIEKYSDTLDIKELALCLYQLHEAGEKYAYLYAGIDGVKRYDSLGAYKRWESELKRIKGNDEFSTLEFSDKMMNFVKWHSDKAVYIQNANKFEGQTAISQANHLIAIQICKWIDKMSKIETVNDTLGIIAYTYPEVIDMGCESEETITYMVENNTEREISAVLNVYSDSGKPMCEGISVNLKKNSKGEFSVPVNTIGISAGVHIYNVKLTENDKVLFEQILPVNCTAIVETELLPAENVMSELTDIRIRLKNIRDEEFKGTVKVISPDGWILESDSIEVILAGSEEKVVSIPIVSKKSTPFNEYLFSVNVTNETGTKIVDIKEIMKFTVIVKADEEIKVEDFSGDISTWANAYPVYLNFKVSHEDNVGMPDDPTDKEAWAKSNVAARCFFKWDENNLYLLADVYDDTLHQIYNDSSLWLGDSVQLSVDTLNDGKYLYQADDYEYAMGYTLASGEQIYCHKSASLDNPAGLRPSEWLKVVRDDNENITRYLFKLPKNHIEPLILEKGARFGMNIGINDSDILQRDRFVQLTTGTCDTKHPEKYYDFVLGPSYSDKDQLKNIEKSSYVIILNSK